jgi:hypothetical protein
MSDINTEMGVTACSSYSKYHSFNAVWSGEQCSMTVNENGSDTYISGNSICAHTTDPDRILTTYSIFLDVRL